MHTAADMSSASISSVSSSYRRDNPFLALIPMQGKLSQQPAVRVSVNQQVILPLQLPLTKVVDAGS